MSSRIIPQHSHWHHVRGLHLQCHNNAGEEADSMRAICSHWPLIPVESDLCSEVHGYPETYRSCPCMKFIYFFFLHSHCVWLWHLTYRLIFWLAYLNLALFCPSCDCDWSAQFLDHSLLRNPSYCPSCILGCFAWLPLWLFHLLITMLVIIARGKKGNMRRCKTECVTQISSSHPNIGPTTFPLTSKDLITQIEGRKRVCTCLFHSSYIFFLFLPPAMFCLVEANLKRLPIEKLTV